MGHFILKQRIELTQMLYIILIIPILLINANNDSDVIIKYAGHSEADITEPDIVPVVNRSTTANWMEDDVVFLPNDHLEEQPDIRNENINDKELYNGYVDVLPTEKIVEDSTLKDTIFITGKNGDEIEKETLRHRESERDYSVRRKEKKVASKEKVPVKLDCTNLICDNTVESICGIRKEDSRLKLRVFRNSCYFRKVNCAFKNEINRYIVVPIEECRSKNAHVISRSKQLPPPPVLYDDHNIVKNETRRSIPSRRSQSMGIDGQACDHTCPTSCTDDYDPQCAMSDIGYKQVFLNHCKLDHHSCVNDAVWYRRPLSECVGNEKADLQQNRGFVGWLQRVGIVDKKGRLVKS